MIAVFVNLLRQTRRQHGHVLLRRQAERQRQHIARLRVAHHAAAGDVSLPPRPDHVVVQCFVLPHVLAQRAAHAHQQLRGIGVVCARDQPLVGRALVAALRRVQPQPVAKVRAAQPQELFLARAVHIVHPFARRIELIDEEMLLPVGQVHLPRHDGRRVRPGRAAHRIRPQYVRDDVRHAPLLVLRGV